MNISFLINDEQLVDAFITLNNIQREEIAVYGTLEALIHGVGQHMDVLIVSDKYFGFEGLCELTETMNDLSNRTNKYLLLSNRHDRQLNAELLKESLAGGWSVIHPGQSNSSIIEQLSASIFGKKGQRSRQRNSIIQFIGSTPNIGTTVAAFGTAAQMAMKTDRSVVYMCLNLKSSKVHRYLGIDNPPYTLEGMRAELKSSSLTSDKLRQYAWKPSELPNLHVIFGNMLREQAEFYTLNDIDCLLQVAARTYDYCIVDTNAYWDNAATISTMMSSGLRLMVTTTQLSHFQEDMNRWLQQLAPIFDCSPKSFDLLITQKESHSTSGYNSRDIRRETGMNRIGELHKFKEMDIMLDQAKLLDAVTKPNVLSEELCRIAQTILHVYGENLVQSSVRSSWLQSVQGLLKPVGRGISFVRK